MGGNVRTQSRAGQRQAISIVMPVLRAIEGKPLETETLLDLAIQIADGPLFMLRCDRERSWTPVLDIPALSPTTGNTKDPPILCA
jgi:hypothetical protein